MPAFTARNVAKYIVKTVVQYKVSNATATAIVNYTDREEDEVIFVQIPAHLVGWGVADKLEPYTDAMVDKTADFVAAKRNKKQDETPES